MPRKLIIEIPLNEDVPQQQLDELLRVIARDWRLWGHVHITNASGISLLDPRHVRYITDNKRRTEQHRGGKLMFYDGWRTVTIIWANGEKEDIEALGRPDPYVKDGILHLRVSDDNKFRHIPLAAIREWRTREHQ